MIYAGCDLGLVSAKVAVVEDGEMLAFEAVPYKGFPIQAVAEAMQRALSSAGLAERHLDRCFSTGVGGKAVARADGVVPELACLCRAVRELNPRARTVVHVGGHSLAAFNISGRGDILESAVVDKCAAGTGIFMDAMVKALDVPLDELVSKCLASRTPLSVTNQCVVFAESEVISLVNDGHDVFDIFAGVASSAAIRIASVVRRVSMVEEVVITGGVAKNDAVVVKLEGRLGLKLAGLAGVDPQAIGAYGAALLAGDGQVAS